MMMIINIKLTMILLLLIIIIIIVLLYCLLTNARAALLEERVRLKQSLDLKGWNSRIRREFPGNPESTNLSRDNLS